MGAGIGRELATLAGHTESVDAVAVTEVGGRAVSASADFTLKVGELESGRELDTFTSDGALLCCTFAGDEALVIAGGAGGRVHFLQLIEADSDARCSRALNSTPGENVL